MLIVGIWIALFLYLISWVFGIFASPLEKRYTSNLPSWLELFGMRIGWGIHTLTLMGILWTQSNWPTSFVIDILSITAWVTMLVVFSFPKRIPSLLNETFVRLFVILLLGLSLIISMYNSDSGVIFSNNTWYYEVLLVMHIIILLASYVMLGVSCVASIIFIYQEYQLKTKNIKSINSNFPSLGTLDRLSWEGSIWGFLALSVGIMIGILINKNDQSLLANLRFGFSISSWFVFAVLLLFRQMRIMRSLWIAVWPVFGFSLAIVSLIVEMLRL
tara:strand:+ start:733 stop:1551 length:819 start_codon:yes stop_codon:yes gene_type:complete